jgi:hypothetical protein
MRCNVHICFAFIAFLFLTAPSALQAAYPNAPRIHKLDWDAFSKISAMEKSGATDEAIAALQVLAKKKRSRLPAHYRLMLLHAQRAQFQKEKGVQKQALIAIQRFATSVLKGLKKPANRNEREVRKSSFRALGYVHAMNRKFGAAKKYFRWSLKGTKNRGDTANAMITETLMRAGQLRAARKFLLTWRKGAGKNSLYWLKRAHLSVIKKKPGEAERFLKRYVPSRETEGYTLFLSTAIKELRTPHPTQYQAQYARACEKGSESACTKAGKHAP